MSPLVPKSSGAGRRAGESQLEKTVSELYGGGSGDSWWPMLSCSALRLPSMGSETPAGSVWDMTRER